LETKERESEINAVHYLADCVTYKTHRKKEHFFISNMALFTLCINGEITTNYDKTNIYKSS
jgi:hypothetical protein